MDEDTEVGRVSLDEDAAIEQVLGENLRSHDLKLMREALEQRRESYLRDQSRATTDHERRELRNKLTELNRQIEAIRQEEGISLFVEGSVRATLNRASSQDE